MRLAEFKLIDKTQGSLTWKIIERMQKTLESIPKNTMNYFSSTIARNQSNSIVIDMNIPKREITINSFK
ncbi:MAG: hypothetical protein HWN65_10880 [Candidatus Helarchaeota archaeon]|nr:hypothetical protein [Candidatus Helarchaeota archaeon]